MNDAERSRPEQIVEEQRRLSQLLGESLRQLGWSCATAESCTGGLIGHLITSIAGSSDYFLGGIVAYANGAKQSLLGVRETTLTSVGAVSPETAIEMAMGARSSLSTELAIASTGIAGPGGATRRKPVGLIYIAVATPGGVAVQELRLNGDRLENINQTATLALQAAIDACERANSKESDERES